MIDKLILFAVSFLLLIFRKTNTGAVAGFLTAVIISSLNSYFRGKKAGAGGLIYSLLCIWRPGLLTFLAPVVYDCAGQKEWYFRFPWILSLVVFVGERDLTGLLSVTAFCALAFLLEVRTESFETAVEAYYDMQDTTREKALHLEKKNVELMEKQDYEVRLATLDERNRIAREIHDNVGHLLTRSLLQVSALLVVHKQEEELKEQLEQVKNTLSDAMDSVRSSVHDLHEGAMDLRLQLERLIGEYQFCPVKLTYKAGELPRELKYCFVSIVKEGLSNIARHSEATQAEVTVVEHPALYQLIIRDNGVQKDGDGQEPLDGRGGIGLQNIRDRVEAFGGVFRVERDNGFRLFISVPIQQEARKERPEQETGRKGW
nr:histidine kinase [Lientehia hominis]